MKNEVKKTSKKFITLTLIFSMLIGYIAPITSVLALSYGTGENFINMDITNEEGYTINSVTVNSYNWTDHEDEFHSNNDQYHIIISVSPNETTGDHVPQIKYGGNWRDYIVSSRQQDGNNYTIVLDLDNSEHQGFVGLTLESEQQAPNNNQNPEQPEPNHQGEEPNEPHFDGKAYVVWSCGNGTCYHYFDNIPNFDDGNSTFYKDKDIKADNNNSITFDVKAKYKGWVLKEAFERFENAYKSINNVSEIDWTKVNPESIIGNPPDMREWEEKAINAKACTKNNTPQDEFERCVDQYAESNGILPFVKLQPVGEPDENNAFVSYGDRNFKVVIYNNDFKGVAMGDLSELNYYPASWTNPFTRRSQFDISGTTKDKPALMDSILLEDTVVIKSLNYNSFEIKSIEALDVPKDAVTITKTSNGDYKLVFSSNFYDNVKFKVKDNNGEESYIQVKRYTIDGWIGHIENRPTLIADFYFDREKSYSDFDLTAKILYKDGTTKNVKLTASNKIDDGLGNITDAYEVDEQSTEFGSGKGLKRSTFIYTLEDGEDREIKDVYLNAEFKGSTETNYAGAYVGSGEGVLANIYHGEDE